MYISILVSKFRQRFAKLGHEIRYVITTIMINIYIYGIENVLKYYLQQKFANLQINFV